MNSRSKKRIAVAMSGGVDSSAAVLMLKREGYDVIGVSMKLWEGSGGKGRCCSLEDFRDARKVADILDIPYYVVNMQDEFRERVIDGFVDAYLRGETPNPCIACNQEMKFDLLLGKAADLGADCLATGHYARIDYDRKRERYVLRKGLDPSKDQSYFLFSMTQEQLSRVIFPLGRYRKEDVRSMLREEGIHIADKEDSQDICFVDEGGYSSFIGMTVDERAVKRGRIISREGEVLGEHGGIHSFTVGQRRGIGVPSDRRMYVLGFDHERNDIIVGDEQHLMVRGLVAINVNWLSIKGIEDKLDVKVKIRYSSSEHRATLLPGDDGKTVVEFDSSQRAVTPGQAAVFYNGDEVLGGGWIERALN